VSSLTTNACRVQDLHEGGASYIFAVDVRGLVKIVPPGVGDMPDKYCINGFAIDAYSELPPHIEDASSQSPTPLA